MRGGTLLGMAAIFLALPQAATAQSSTFVQITVHTGAANNSHPAPVLGQMPVSLERAMQSAGINYTVTWFPSVPGYAAMIIDNYPSTTSGGFASPFWWVCINGYSSPAGLQTLVKAGDQVDWSMVTDGKCPKDSGH